MRIYNISFQIKIHLPAILSKQKHNTNQRMAVELSSGDYWYFVDIETSIRKKRAIMTALHTIFAGINMPGGLTIKADNPWLVYKRSKQICM